MDTPPNHMEEYIQNKDQSIVMMVVARIDYDGNVIIHLLDLISHKMQTIEKGNIWPLSEKHNRKSIATLHDIFTKEVKKAWEKIHKDK